MVTDCGVKRARALLILLKIQESALQEAMIHRSQQGLASTHQRSRYEAIRDVKAQAEAQAKHSRMRHFLAVLREIAIAEAWDRVHLAREQTAPRNAAEKRYVKVTKQQLKQKHRLRDRQQGRMQTGLLHLLRTVPSVAVC